MDPLANRVVNRFLAERRVTHVGMEFPTLDALRKYLHKHPQADKSKHKVESGKPEESDKPEPKAEKGFKTAPGSAEDRREKAYKPIKDVVAELEKQKKKWRGIPYSDREQEWGKAYRELLTKVQKALPKPKDEEAFYDAATAAQGEGDKKVLALLAGLIQPGVDRDEFLAKDRKKPKSPTQAKLFKIFDDEGITDQLRDEAEEPQHSTHGRDSTPRKPTGPHPARNLRVLDNFVRDVIGKP